MSDDTKLKKLQIINEYLNFEDNEAMILIENLVSKEYYWKHKLKILNVIIKNYMNTVKYNLKIILIII